VSLPRNVDEGTCSRASVLVFVGAGMIFRLSLVREITNMMFPAGGNAGNPPGGLPLPPASRTTFTYVPGDSGRQLEDRWELPGDSPVVTAWPFLCWSLGGQPQTASAPRSSVVGTILLVSRRPAEESWLDLDNESFISTELDMDVASE
jgi:hypothetical protein